MRAAAGLFALACACSSSKPTKNPEITGTLTFNGKAVTSMQCRAGAAVHIFVDIVTPDGVLHLEDKQLSFNGGPPLACDKLDRSWGGGRRPDNSAYWRGTLAFKCVAEKTEIVGDLVLDCGNITPVERAQLDGQRKDLREEQRDAGSGSAAGSGS